VALASVGVLARPTFVGVPFGLEQSAFESALGWFGVLGVMVGYVWLVLFYLRDPDDRPSSAGFR
jgi:hypothetical protein